MRKYKIRPFAAVILALVMVLSLLIITGCSNGSGSEESTEEVFTTNPLTGQTEEEGFDITALDRRIAAFVVENAQEARPQWGMDDPEYSPDIVLQGEVEAGITRMLWMYADYNKLPKIIGPMRSARPPYIKFSELFDSVFIHWGQSASKGRYVGANTVFKTDGVDHINQMKFANKSGLFDRDNTRSVAMEHTGIVYGSKVPVALEEAKVRMEPKEYTRLNFTGLAWLVSPKQAKSVRVTYSDVASWERTFWTYNEDDKKYHTANFNNDFARDNLLILYDETEYVEKEDYQGSGSSITYCNYALGGGKGVLCSQGTYKDIEWRVEDGKLVLIDVAATAMAQARAAEEETAAAEGEQTEADSEEAAAEEGPVEVQAAFYPGKTWIGWISSNNGGKIDIGDSASGSGSEDSSEEQ